MEAREDIAIIGMSCLFPGAPTLARYWQNIVSKVDAVGDPPEDWGTEFFYDPASSANDRVYCKRGGYIGGMLRFHPGEYGVMPRAVDGSDPDHFVGLMVTKAALQDAGYLERPFDGRCCEVIIGRGTYINRGFSSQIAHCFIVDEVVRLLRRLLPEQAESDLERVKRELKQHLPPFTADVAPGLVPNVMTGRIANRFDLMGTNYTVDAACASSLIALEHGVRDLRAGTCDMALVGGANVATTPPMLMLFCLLNALSRKERIRPFSASADGTLLGEGYGMVVLKRYADAKRDGDRVYALVKGVGSASDGRATSVLAPRVEGEVLAIRRAYEDCSVPTESIGLIEAHGTGTLVGDATEVEALRQVFGERRPGEPPRCGLGTVKSMISHLIPAAGIAGLIKTALALYHKILPPTLHCEDPSPALRLETAPFYLNTETRPWIHGGPAPRRAGINAFGFGGINAHAVLEEVPESAGRERPNLHHAWDSEAIILEADDREALLSELERLSTFLQVQQEVRLVDLAATCNTRLKGRSLRLAFVAASVEDLRDKLARARKKLAQPSCRRIRDATGIYFSAEPLARSGKVALLFPGEGAQYRNMLADLCLHFPEMRAWFDLMDQAFAGHPRGYVPSQVVFPPPEPGGQVAAEEQDELLFGMDSAVEAVFAANQACATLLGRLAVRPHAVLGHSTGEYSALMAAGAIRIESEEQLVRHILDLNRVYEAALERGDIPQGVLLAVAPPSHEAVAALVADAPGPLFLSMDNCPHQVVLCGTSETTEWAAEELARVGAVCQPLPFSRAYHTPLFEPFCGPLSQFFAGLNFASPHTPVYTCVTASQYPSGVSDLRELAVRQWAAPVRFRETIESMYADGVRIFVEAGPRGNLCAFVEDTLRGRPHLAVPMNVQSRSGTLQLNHAIAQLAVHGVSLDAGPLYLRRGAVSVDLTAAAPPSAARAAGEMKLPVYLTSLRLEEDSPPLVGRSPVRPEPPQGNAACAQVTWPETQAGPVAEPSLGAAMGPQHPGTVAWSQTGGADTRAQAMQAYLQTMDRFLSTQQAVMEGVITALGRKATERAAWTASSLPEGVEALAASEARARDSDPGRSRRPVASSRVAQGYPLIGRVVSLVPGESLQARREFQLERDLFLFHHTIGSRTVAADKRLTALPVVPLTVSMEVMAEAAALLAPGQRLVALREVRGYRWVGLDRGTLALEITASRRREADGVRITVRIFELGSGPRPDSRFLVMEGEAIFADQYPEAPKAQTAFTLQNPQPSRWHGDVRYQDGMFHGPAFQAVLHVDRTGTDGTEATLEVLPTDGLFRDDAAPALVTDPVILDAAGQVVGYWALEHLETGFNVFPFRLEELRVYAPNLSAHQRVTCRARLTHVTDSETRSDIDLIQPDGRLWMHLKGWWDRRFDMPMPFYRFRITPLEVVLSRAVPAAVSHFREPSNFRCMVLDSVPRELMVAGWMIWARVLAHLVLARSEREEWLALELTEDDRIEWLLRRTVAKDALRVLFQERLGLTVYPADIELAVDGERVSATGYWLDQVPVAPALCWAYRDGAAIAVAGIDTSVTRLGLTFADRARPWEGEASVASSVPADGWLVVAAVGGSSVA